VRALAEISAVIVAAVNGLTGIVGAVLWWRVQPAESWWVWLRLSQALCALEALVAGGLYVAGFDPDDNLFWLYALLPIPVNFVAEQFRIISAQTVLDARGLPDAHAVGRLPDDTQRSIVRQIMRREVGVMVLGVLVTAFLLLRAAGTAG
jgi:hypothetical protein